MTIWPIMVEGWQIECCLTPPAVGDAVEWQLCWLTPEAHGELAVQECVYPEETPLTPADSAEHEPGILLRSGGLSAWSLTPTLPVHPRGYLSEDHHGWIPPEMPATQGIVREISVVTIEYGRSEQGRLTGAVAGTSKRRPVTSSPKQFDAAELMDANIAHPRNEIGILVDLDVRDRPGSPVDAR
ncbi:DUF6578 domain-containing protein [Sciscionella sediminilitoris]|uniref:DUF6578 domain-containing protein n=1 Tax=Sciscionella sediminilitoris TaxID=1445613 RepID=UPI0004DFBC3A|nr:DUF6578 domain-containing protein [Sciscionella sp. SE31]